MTVDNVSFICGCSAIRRLAGKRAGAGFLVIAATLLSGCLAGTGGDSTDPVVVENAVAFVKRPLLFDENNGMLIGDNVAEPAAFRPGARLFLKNRAAPTAPARDISSSAFSGSEFLNEAGQLRYDVKDLSVSFDGERILFAMRAPEIEGADEEDQPTWNIWEYSIPTDSLRRVISSDVTAEAGQDIAPAYLPDGRIVFSSTRQRASRAILLDEGKPQYAGLEENRDTRAFVLHVMSDDGSTIEQITFNQSHDLDPLVQDDGSILFSRWDNAGQTRNNGFNLYRVNPDGTALTYQFGRHSHGSIAGEGSIEYLRPRLTDGSRILTELRPLQSDNFSAIPTTVNVTGYVEFNRTVEGTNGSGQAPLVSGLSIGDGISLSGNYGAVSPLLDGSNRYLVSWSPCRLTLPGSSIIVNCTSDRIASGSYEAAVPVYGLWLLDTSTGTQRPIESPTEGQQFDEAVLVKARSLPAFLNESQYSGEAATLADDGYGIVEIRSVYDIDGVDSSPLGISATADPVQLSPDDLPVRFVRIEKPVSIPDDTVQDFDNTAFGRNAGQSMREIVGYAPIEPDGSVRIAVPSNIAFAISVLDDQGQRLGARHQNWLNVRPGETLSCNGCHNPASDVAHGRPDASPESVYDGAPTTGLEFPNTEPALFADMGETMAQTWARINGTRRLVPDPAYVDDWTDDAIVAKGTSFTLAYGDLETPVPIFPECAADWARACRIVINYEQHIHPLWGLDRGANTCTDCHTNQDAVSADRVPDGQLDLTDGPSDQEPDHFKAYRELLITDNEQELDAGGMLIDRMVDTGEFLRDDVTGELILDQNGDPIPIFAPVPVEPSMSVAGARQSDVFLDRFRPGGTPVGATVNHEGLLSPSELRLLSEWLDIGAQYYNNPFDAPAN